VRRAAPSRTSTLADMKLLAITGALALGLALAASGSSARNPSFAFGRIGGNIQPYTVKISPRGTLSTNGPVALRNPDKKLSATALASLLKLATRERFFSLPRRISCAGALPDFASMFVTVSTATRTKTVAEHGGCSTRFEAVLTGLEVAAGVPLSQR
jgi:hypothetical protein